MKKVLLIGPGGAGKSTFARRLSERTGIPTIHLDSLYWRPGWQEPSKAEWQRVVGELVQANCWIMDGNYSGTMELRIAACDTIILFDLPPIVCLWRVLKRRLRFHGKPRPEMAPGCPERLDWAFAWWILTYRTRRLPALLEKLATAIDQGKTAVVLRTNSEVEEYFHQVPHAA